MKTILWCFVCSMLLSVSGCRSFRQQARKEASQTTRIALTDAQQEYLKKYCRIRKKVTDFFSLPAGAASAEIRPCAAEFLELPRAALWEEIFHTPFLRAVCTEERRKKFTILFGLPTDATWPQLGVYIEELWVRMRVSQ